MARVTKFLLSKKVDDLVEEHFPVFKKRFSKEWGAFATKQGETIIVGDGLTHTHTHTHTHTFTHTVFMQISVRIFVFKLLFDFGLWFNFWHGVEPFVIETR